MRDMGETDLKAALIENLNKHLDDEIHSVPELSYRFLLPVSIFIILLISRKVSDNKGGLCGIAAMYQALENTIVTTSALEKLTYDTMKEIVGDELGLENSKPEKDFDILKQYYKCVYL